MNRRSLIVMLIGVLAAFSGLTAVQLLRRDRCDDSGGQWVAAMRRCTLPDGTILDVVRTGDLIAGALIAAAIGFMLIRVFLFATGRAGRRTETTS